MFTLKLCLPLLERGDGDLAFLLFARRPRWRSLLFFGLTFLANSTALAIHECMRCVCSGVGVPWNQRVYFRRVRTQLIGRSVSLGPLVDGH